MARVGIDVVAAKSGLHQFGGGVALLNGVLARAHHRHAGGAQLGIGLFESLLHLIESARPRHRHEVALFIELAVLHAQQRLGQAVLAVENLAVEIALDAVEAAIDRGIGVALGGDDTAVLGGDLDAAADAAKTANALVPAPAFIELTRHSLGSGTQWNTSAGRCCGGETGF